MKATLRHHLENTFNLSNFRPAQEEIVDHITSGGSCLVLMPTGMGKSLCYQLPAMALPGLTLVLSPLISLMKDQADKLKELGVAADYLNSSLSKSQRQARLEGLKKGAYKLLYVAPERFKSREFVETIKGCDVSLLAVDEAHCISQWGSDFRPDYSDIPRFRKILGEPVTVALTATATPEVQQDIVRNLGVAPEQVEIFNQGICRENLYLEVRPVLDEIEKFEQLELLLSKNQGKGQSGGNDFGQAGGKVHAQDNNQGSTIVYFNLIKALERFSRHLQTKHVKHSIYHGKLPPARRAKVQSDFMAGRAGLMLATNAFGMGVDKPDIRRVIHAAVPATLEAYYQEIGRAGRDGLPSQCILFYCQDDLAVQLDFLQWSNPGADYLRKVYQLFESLGEGLPAYDYEALQAKLHYKNRGDNRLQTVVNLFERYGVTTGDMEAGGLRLAGPLPPNLTDAEAIAARQEAGRGRLIEMVNYTKTSDCRRSFIHNYFAAPTTGCGNCDLCLSHK